jgi:hypothetical protein
MMVCGHSIPMSALRLAKWPFFGQPWGRSPRMLLELAGVSGRSGFRGLVQEASGYASAYGNVGAETVKCLLLGAGSSRVFYRVRQRPG